MIGWRFYDSGPLRDVLEHLGESGRRWGGRGEPMPVNAHQTASELVIEALVPGVRPEDVELSCAEGTLIIEARSTVPERDYQHQEFREVLYHRQLMLPADCRCEEATAELEHGVLVVRIPKLKPREPERIRIEVQRKSSSAPIEATKGEGYREVPPAPKSTPRKPPAKKG